MMQMQGDTFSAGKADELEFLKQRFKTGGKMDDTYSKALERTGNRFVARTLAKFDDGGYTRPLDRSVIDNMPQNLMEGSSEQERLPFFKRPGVQTGLMDAGQTITAAFPSIANMSTLSNLPQTPGALLQRPVNLQEINADDQLSAIRGATQEANVLAGQVSPQAGTQAGMVGRNLAERLKAESSVMGDVNRQNAAIQNQEASINAGINARNLAARREAQNDALEREKYRIEGMANQRAGLANSLLGVGNQISKRREDRSALDALTSGDTTGSIGRLLDIIKPLSGVL